jgi:hypothetical protein
VSSHGSVSISGFDHRGVAADRVSSATSQRELRAGTSSLATDQSVSPARTLGITAILYTSYDPTVTDLAGVGIDNGFRRDA